MLAQAPSPTPRPDVLLDQQLWFLGQDIRHRDGNALARFGFTRCRAPEAAASAYVLPLDGRTALVCVGFGVYLGPVRYVEEHPVAPELPGLLWRRHQRQPRLTRCGLLLPLRGLKDLPETVALSEAATRATHATLVRQLADLFASYERWALATLGLVHRGRALSALPRHKRRRLPALEPALTVAWSRLPM